MADILGSVAGVLVPATFNTCDFLTLRSLASASNLAFILYGTLLAPWPVAGLHAILLPVNLWHLWRLLRVRKLQAGQLLSLPPIEDHRRFRRREPRRIVQAMKHR